MGKIIYLGNRSFQIKYNGENLIIDPYLKWLHTKNLLNKDDPLSFTFADNLKHKFRSIQEKEMTSLIDQMDYVLLSSPNYSHIDQLKELMDKNPNLLIIAPRSLIKKIKSSLKKKIPGGVDFISINNSETIRFTRFELKAVPTEKDRSLMNMLTDSEKNSLSYTIHCGSLKLFHSGVGVGKPIGLEFINMATLPMSFSRYNDLETLKGFCDFFKPKLIIPFLYSAKVFQEISMNQDEFNKKYRIYFPKIGTPIEWD